MSVTSGFFNSNNGDRKYGTDQISSLFDGIIRDGVFSSIGDRFIVKSTGGMSITVGTGRAWFNSTWTLNDALLPFTISAADVALPRYTSVVLEIDTRDSVRANSIKLINGTPSSSPTPNSDSLPTGVYRYRLADIYVANGATSISQSNITNKVGSSICPFVTGILKTVDTDDLVAQWQDQFNVLFDKMEEAIADILDGLVPEGSVSVELNGTITTSWSGSDPFTQRITVIGMHADDKPIVDISLSNNYDTSLKEAEEYGYILRFTPGEGYVDVQSTDATSVPLNVKFICVRK